ncbi:MAG TPA: hypothetical protein VGI19_00435 [Candidatus Cybelea sp.]|jgi:DNA-binding beta-propeller fold protein YncE
MVRIRIALCSLTSLIAACAATSPLTVNAPPAHLTPNAPGLARMTSLPTPPPNCGRYGPCSVDACFGAICIAYSTEGSVQAELTSGIVYAQGVAADPKGNVYIADAGQSVVFEYGPYLKALVKTYQDYGQVPLDVAVDPKIKLLATSNQSTASGGAGSVSVFAGGSLTPTATLSDEKVSDAQGIGVAIDGHGDCFWSFYDPASTRSKIDEFPACSGSPKTIASGKRALRGMAFDRQNDLFYIVDVNASDHAVFKCRKTTRCRQLATDFAKPVMLNFDRHWRFLWTDDAGVLEGPLIESIDPQTGQVTSSFRAGSSFDPPFGIAHVPGPG